MMLTGRQILFDALRRRGVDTVFGNPGTSELWFMEELIERPDVRYVLGLMEAAVITMADAYAHASGKTAVANLHIAPGLGNAIGSLYNAKEKHAPLVVTAGQTDTRMRLRSPMTSGDLVRMAEPVTKWSAQAEQPEELPLLLDRAFRIAETPPTGPVFLSLPINVMDAVVEAAPIEPSPPTAPPMPNRQAIERAAAMVAEAGTVAIVVGDRAGRSARTVEALVRLAELVAAEVWLETLPAHVGFPVRHPAFRGRLPQDLGQIRDAIGAPEAVLLVDGDFFEEVWYVEAAPWPETASVIQVDVSPTAFGENHRIDCGLWADPAEALEALCDSLGDRLSPDLMWAIQARTTRIAEQRRLDDESYAESIRGDLDNGRLTPATMISEIARATPPEAAVTCEIFGNTTHVLKCFDFEKPGDFLSARGGGIGQAIPSAVGMAIARPGRPVLAITGDGSALYTIQALWTAAQQGLPIVAVVLNNGGYGILKSGFDYYRGRRALESLESYPHLDLEEPAIGFVELARGLGVTGRRISDIGAVAPAVHEAFETGKPTLLDIVVE